MFMEDKCCICGKALAESEFKSIRIHTAVEQFRCCKKSTCKAAVTRMKKAIARRQIEKWGSELVKN
jgi:hypothetical protein